MDGFGDRSLLWAELRSCRARRRRGGGDVDCLDVGIVVVEAVEVVGLGILGHGLDDDEDDQVGVPPEMTNRAEECE